MNKEAINKNLSSAIFFGRTRLRLRRKEIIITGRRNRHVLLFSVHMFNLKILQESKPLSICLHICTLLVDKSHGDARSGCNVFFLPTVVQKVCVYIHYAFLGPARGGLPKCIVQPL